MNLARTGMYALGEDLARAMWTSIGHIRWAASKYGWRKVRVGRRMRYHVEDAMRDLGPGMQKRWEKIVDRWIDEQDDLDTPYAQQVLDYRSRAN